MFAKKIGDRFELTDLDGAKALVSFTEHILGGLAINITIVKDLAQGYRIFSSENTTGLKLGNLDILRALILAHCDRKKFGPSVLEGVKQHLANMMANLVELSQGEGRLRPALLDHADRYSYAQEQTHQHDITRHTINYRTNSNRSICSQT